VINVLLYCEGNTDRGQEEFIESEYVFSDGMMQVLIRKVSRYNDIVFIVIKRQDLKAISIRKGCRGRDDVTSLRLAFLARQHQCTHIAYHRDEDNKGLQEKYDEVQKYFMDARKRNLNCLAIIPMHMTESWLLADKNAYKIIYGSIPTNPPLPPKPEETWGNKGTDNHPKKYLERVLKQYHNTTISADAYAETAKNSDIEVMKQQCPESFAKKFFADMQTFITPEGITP
jgi:hypothetical protein